MIIKTIKFLVSYVTEDKTIFEFLFPGDSAPDETILTSPSNNTVDNAPLNENQPEGEKTEDGKKGKKWHDNKYIPYILTAIFIGSVTFFLLSLKFDDGGGGNISDTLSSVGSEASNCAAVATQIAPYVDVDPKVIEKLLQDLSTGVSTRVLDTIRIEIAREMLEEPMPVLGGISHLWNLIWRFRECYEDPDVADGTEFERIVRKIISKLMRGRPGIEVNEPDSQDENYGVQNQFPINDPSDDEYPPFDFTEFKFPEDREEE